MQDLPSATLVLRDTLSSILVKPVHLVLQIVLSAMSPEAEIVTLALASRDSICLMVPITTALDVPLTPAAKPAWTNGLVLHVSMDTPLVL